jgi:hypothetical protein
LPLKIGNEIVGDVDRRQVCGLHRQNALMASRRCSSCIKVPVSNRAA